jgi:hypothetical protein
MRESAATPRLVLGIAIALYRRLAHARQVGIAEADTLLQVLAADFSSAIGVTMYFSTTTVRAAARHDLDGCRRCALLSTLAGRASGSGNCSGRRSSSSSARGWSCRRAGQSWLGGESPESPHEGGGAQSCEASSTGRFRGGDIHRAFMGGATSICAWRTFLPERKPLSTCSR